LPNKALISEECKIFTNDDRNEDYYYTWKGASISCPSNWRIPKMEDWLELFLYFGGYRTSRSTPGLINVVIGFTAIGDRGKDPKEAYRSLIDGGVSGFNAQFKGKMTEWSSTPYNVDDEGFFGHPLI
jgi:uncharacterized protein (TIGR02145 family)